MGILVGVVSLAGLVAGKVVVFHSLEMPVEEQAWIMAGLTAFLLGGGFAQYFHGTLHRQDNPWFVPVLRRIGLLMTPAAHQLHHDTLQRDFATNCGWSNPVINALFRALRQRGWLDDAGLTPSP